MNPWYLNTWMTPLQGNWGDRSCRQLIVIIFCPSLFSWNSGCKDDNLKTTEKIYYEKSYQPEDYYTKFYAKTPSNILRDTIVGIVLLFLSLVATCSNIFICAVVLKYKIYKTTQQMVILLLALSDFIIFLILVPLDGLFFLCKNPVVYSDHDHGHYVCGFPIRVQDINIVFRTVLPIASFVLC